MRWLVVLALVACTTHEHDSHVEQGVTQCGPPLVDGIDVYSGNGTIDWARTKAAGKDFAFIKATQGDYNKQSTFPSSWANAKANGVLRSAYHYFDATIDGKLQAQAFLDEVNAAGGMGVGDLPAMFDVECPVSPTQNDPGNKCLGTGANGWAPTDTIRQRMFDWLDTVEAATGRKPIIYSYVSWFGSLGITDAKLADYPLFIASYNTCATIPAPWTSAVFWQYSATGTVDGITGQVDLDHFFGTAADLNGFTIQPAGNDAGVQPDADTTTGGDQAGCGCHGAGRGHLAATSLLAFATLLLMRGRSRRPRRRR